MDIFRTKVAFYVAHREPDPLNLVQAAIKYRDQNQMLPGDEIWCVFDVENPIPHQTLEKALELSRTKRINVALSNPCFEVWLLSHFDRLTRSMTTNEAKRKFSSGWESWPQGLDSRKVLDAIENAKELQRLHIENATSHPRDNPSSGVHSIFEQFV
jgi:hypothetical protein